MVRLRNTSTQSGAGPILGALGAVGLTIAFVALGRSKPRQGDQDLNKREAFATYLRDPLAAQTRRSKWSKVSGMPTEDVPRAPSSNRCTTSFAKIAASSRESSPSSGTPRGQRNDWRVERPGMPFA